MRYDYIHRFWNKFSDKGFKRLIEEGSFCKNTNYNYLFTQTAPGQATIATGTNPGNHGIVGDYWFDRLQSELKYCVSDTKVEAVGGNQSMGEYSPRKLISSTIGDELQLSNFKKSKVFSVALDPKSSILLAGHTANAAYWFDPFSGNWMTSSFYLDSLQQWVNDFNLKAISSSYLERNWEPLLPIGDYTESSVDMSPYEHGIKKNEVNFPYELPKLRKHKNDYNLINQTPFGNVYTKDFAIATIVNEELGLDEYPDVLTVSFSAMNQIGLHFGPISVELEDAYIRFDQELGHFLDFINDYVGKENVLVYLTSDHGTSYHPDFLKSQKVSAGEFNPLPAISLLKSYLNVTYGSGKWIEKYSAGQIYLNQNLIEDSKYSLKEMQEKIAQFIIQFTGVENASTAYALANSNYTAGVFEKMQNGYNQKRSGDVIINLEPGWIENTDFSSASNSGYKYDTHVPLIWYGWKVKRNSIVKAISPEDIAPTLAMFLNITLPNNSSGNPIIELIE